MKRIIISLFILLFTFISWPSAAQVDITVSFGPPPLPVYEQPPCPDDGYIWTPGYWAYDNYFGYYWVPGTWVQAPQPGLLWTPGWWGWNSGAFLFHEGYWADQVGFYGGINYGFGYFGDGYAGGRWDGNNFFYNRAVSNINVTNIHNVYSTTVVNNITVNHVSYNGGQGGVEARPTHEQEEVAQERHVSPQAAQLEHIRMARSNPQLRAEENHGKPAVAATPRPAVFSGAHIVAAKEAGGSYESPARKMDHASSVPNHQAPQELAREKTTTQDSQAATATPPRKPQEVAPGQQHAYEGNAQALVDHQNEEHEQLKAQQQREHEQAKQNNLADQRQREMEQRHAQETAQMEQRHMREMQNVQHSEANRPSEHAHPKAEPPQRER